MALHPPKGNTDITDGMDWLRAILGVDSTELTDDSGTRFIYSAIRKLFSYSNYLETQYPSDFTDDETDLFWEAVGFVAASTIVILPPEQGREVVTEITISIIKEKYRVPDEKYLSAKFLEAAFDRIGQIPGVLADFDAARAVGRTGVIQSRPTRFNSIPTSDSLFHELLNPTTSY